MRCRTCGQTRPVFKAGTMVQTSEGLGVVVDAYVNEAIDNHLIENTPLARLSGPNHIRVIILKNGRSFLAYANRIQVVHGIIRVSR